MSVDYLQAQDGSILETQAGQPIETQASTPGAATIRLFDPRIFQSGIFQTGASVFVARERGVRGLNRGIAIGVH
jgi:hypothetical protein